MKVLSSVVFVLAALVAAVPCFAQSPVDLSSGTPQGWLLLTDATASQLTGTYQRQYLYLRANRWYMSPVTTLVWSWTQGQQLTGTYTYFDGAGTGWIYCGGSDERPQWGVGCSDGGGFNAKVLTVDGNDPAAGQGTVCQDFPDIFSVGNCGVATIYVRIIVDPSAPPVLQLPGDLRVAGGPSGRLVFFNASAWDVDGLIPVTCTPPSGSLFPVGATYVSCTATNSRGLSASGSFNVTVEQVQVTVNSDGLVGWWKFDEVTGTIALDSSGNGRDGTISGGTYTTNDGADIPGNVSALRLPASVALPYTPALNFGASDPFTFSFWIRVPSDFLDEYSCIVNKPTVPIGGRSDYAICNAPRDGLYVVWWNGLWMEGTSVNTGRLDGGRLTHIAVVYDGAGTLQFYRDGQMVSAGGDHERGAFTGLVPTGGPVFLGGLHGMLDDVRVYNRALSWLEIASLNLLRGLEVYQVATPYSGTTTLKAVLFSNGSLVPGKVVSFTLGGTFVGTAVTDATGVATLIGVSVAGFGLGDNSNAIGASVPGDAQIPPASAAGMLTVFTATPVITWNLPVLQFGAPLDASHLSATANVAGTLDYSSSHALGTPLIGGSQQLLCVTFTPTDQVNYTQTSMCVPIAGAPTILPQHLGSLLLFPGAEGGGYNSAVDVARNLLYIGTNNGSDDTDNNALHVIDGRTNSVVDQIWLSKDGVSAVAMGVAVDSEAGRIYVTSSEIPALWVLDASTRQVLEIIDLPPDVVGSEITMNPATGVVYLANGTTALIVVNTKLPSGDPARVGVVPIPGFAPGNVVKVRVNPTTNLVYVCCGAVLPVVDGDPAHGTFNTVVATVPLSHVVGTLAVNPQTNLVYLFGNSLDTVTTVVDGDPTNSNFHSIVNVVSDLRAQYYFLLYDPTTHSPGFTQVYVDPVVNPVTNRIYVRVFDCEVYGENLMVLDGSTLAVLFAGWAPDDHSLNSCGASPGLLVNPVTNRIYIGGDVWEDVVVDVLATTPGPAGVPVVVTSAQASVTFAGVTAGGVTQVVPVAAAELNLQLPGAFSIEGAQAYEVSTTAGVVPPIVVCFNAASVGNPERFADLRVLHGENGVLVDRTTSSDFTTRTICATVDSLSPFVVAHLAAPRNSDRTPPMVQCSQVDAGWRASDATIACTASDADSGLANPADASFTLTTAVPAGVEIANALTNDRTVCDNAGNCVIAGLIGGSRIDRKAPTITITGPTSSTFLLGEQVASSYSCEDGGSGVAACSGPVQSGAPIDTGTVGSRTFSVTGSDAVGNAAAKTVAFTVAYGQCLLFDQTKAYKAGSTIPIKLNLCNAAGANVSSSSVALVAKAVYLVSTSAPGPLADSGNANADYQFRFAGGSYVFNLSLAGFSQGTYALVFTAGNDPTTHTVQFQVK